MTQFRKDKKSQGEFEHYNIHGDLVQNLGQRIFETEAMLSRAYEGRASEYTKAKSWILSLRNKIQGMGLNYSPKKLKIIDLYIELSKKISQQNDFENATDYLWSAFKEIQLIFKINNLLFPKKAKSVSFNDYATSEIG